MKMIRSVLMLIALISVAWFGCKKIPVGFIGESMYYKDSPFKIEQGNIKQVTSSLNLDGSTLPVNVKLLEVRVKGTNQRADDFYKEHEVYVYKQPIDPAVDTTIAMVNAKREKKMLPPFEFLPSGQFLFNAGTIFLPARAQYEFDIEVSNESGSRVYKNIGEIQLQDAELFRPYAIANSWFSDQTGLSGTVNSTPEMIITKVSNQGTNAIVKIVDKNGVPFNPKKGEIIKRGDRPTFESYAKFNPVVIGDESMTCNYEITPFPMKRISGYGDFLMYYRIPSTYATLDNFPAGQAPGSTFSINPRFGFQIKQEGTYLITIKLNGVTHK
ncbi:DUF5007 domain-containing protein [Pedobacter steynii]|uniref:DUF5007 domain-containing protein n=1 Tax=Pedobacter steynii TaxID=430522 RepID=A0A1D7QI51_9SPHI|nr:DUF5007 domain-containing protein [Pedobacter steynii]AOM78338.1 hypothetical protein BFS30_14830 [Pedobacter steynii]